jgi:hypothetical protein
MTRPPDQNDPELLLAEEAEKLASWLDAGAGALPPQGVDPAVVESVYVLRPDLAPAPRTTVESILASVRTGPLVASVESAKRERRVSVPWWRGFRVWLWPGVGLAAAAAMALLIVLPKGGPLQRQHAATPPPRAGETEAAPAPVPEAAQSAASPSAAGAPSTPFSPLAAREAKKAEEVLSGRTARLSPEAPAPSGAQLSPRGDTEGALAETVPSKGGGELRPAPPSNEDLSDERSWGGAGPASSAASAGVAQSPPSTASTSKRMDYADEAQGERERASDLDEGLSRSRRSEKSDKTAAARPQTDTPGSYDAVWYLSDRALDDATRARVASAHATASEASRASDLDGAIAALEPLLVEADPDVAQDAAYWVATWQESKGDHAAALSTVRRGLAASSRSSIFRSRLLELQRRIRG